MKSLLRRLRRIDYLIHQKVTGSPASLAKQIGISERSLYDYLRIMKDMGAPITYSRNLVSYYYKERGTFYIAFVEYDHVSEPDTGYYEENFYRPMA